MIKIYRDCPGILVKLDREKEIEEDMKREEKRKEKRREIFLCITEIITNI